MGAALLSGCATSHPPGGPAAPRTPAHSGKQANDLPATLSEREAINGSILLVDVLSEAHLPENAQVTGSFEGISLPFYRKADGSYEAVLGIPYEHKPGESEVKVSADGRSAELALRITAGQFRSETLKTAGKYVNPSKKALKRILREKSVIGQVYSRVTEHRYWDGPFKLPIESEFKDVYGTRRVFNGELQSSHLGLDLRATVGTPIKAAAGGVVALARDLYYTGNTVIIDHGYGVLTLYAHMSKVKVRPGQVVQAGDQLGLSGATGRVTGPHLHWMAIVHKIKANPLDLTRVMTP